MHPTCQGHVEWSRPQVLEKEAPQMPTCDPEAIRQRLHSSLVERAVGYQAQRSRDETRRAQPRRCSG